MADEKQVQDTRPDVIEVDPSMRTDLVLAFMKRRIAHAEKGEAEAKVDAIVAKLDKDGELRKAVAQAQEAMVRFSQADAGMTELLAKVQEKVGVSLAGYRLDPENGTIRKQAPAPAPQKPTPLPTKGKKGHRHVAGIKK